MFPPLHQPWRPLTFASFLFVPLEGHHMEIFACLIVICVLLSMLVSISQKIHRCSLLTSTISHFKIVWKLYGNELVSTAQKVRVAEKDVWKLLNQSQFLRKSERKLKRPEALNKIHIATGTQ